jgi:aldehyde:ferredoxin oxidoreductase
VQPILRINLSSRAIDEFIIPHEWEVDYLGGASLGARLLYKELLPGLDPLSEQASLLFLNGPLSGTSGPAVGRFVVALNRLPPGYGENLTVVVSGGLSYAWQDTMDCGLLGKQSLRFIFPS